jgi:DNA-binding NtrC family response regulator
LPLLDDITQKRFMRPRVVILSTDSNLISACRMVLEWAGYKVQTPPERMDFKEFVKTIRTDLFIVDVLSWTFDHAYETDLLKQIKNGNSIKYIPVLILSSHSRLAEKAPQLGAPRFLIKPFTSNELLALVTELTEPRKRNLPISKAA